MQCDELRELSDAYAIGALDPSEREAVERHAELCSACHDFLEHASLVASSLALAAPLRPAPRELHARVMNQVANESEATEAPIKHFLIGEPPQRETPAWRRPDPRRWSWNWLQPVAACAAV